MYFPATTPDWVQQCPRPWVVADWGALRELSRNDGLPGKFTVIIHGRVLAEVLGTPSPAAFLNKLDCLLSHPNAYGRVLFGKDMAEIEASESTPRMVHGGSAFAIHFELSERIRRSQEEGRLFQPENEWVELPPHDHQKARFVDMIKEFSRWQVSNRGTGGELRPGKIADLFRFTQVAHEAMVRIASHRRSRYKSPAWAKVLREFPDRCAAGRWLRLAFWYALQHSVASETNDRQLGNNYDDAHYVFLSLYSKHLWTRDTGMQHAATAVSGQRVHLYSRWEDIPTY